MLEVVAARAIVRQRATGNEVSLDWRRLLEWCTLRRSAAVNECLNLRRRNIWPAALWRWRTGEYVGRRQMDSPISSVQGVGKAGYDEEMTIRKALKENEV